MVADPGAAYDVQEHIDLSTLEPLIAKPSSPGNVVPVREAAGEEVFQVVVGSSANPGLRDFAVVAEILRGRQPHDRVSLDINPSSREILEDLTKGGWTFDLIRSGARIHQSGCMGCIGMGQAPAVGRNSLRTMPRNFPGRSGTDEDSVWLCSPETAAAAALTGTITDPRDLDMRCPRPRLPDTYSVNTRMLLPPLGEREARDVELVKGENVKSLPEFDPLPDDMELPVMLTVGDNVSTDEIMPAGSRVLPFRSNIPRMADFVYLQVDDTYPTRAAESHGGHAIVGGDNYGQGSSREHAVIAPRYLGLRVVVAKSFARIHWQNLANFGVLPLEFEDPADADRISQDDVLRFTGLRAVLESSVRVPAQLNGEEIALTHRLSERQVSMVLAGGRIAHRAGEDPTIEAKPSPPEG
ncbi:aconitase family protein [Brevibacterium jeotgali]|uniref:aconitase family protein n=1 Tax=Brevibacterium jeotgali TaxID=1262550 RepID=UPI00248260DF|nr:aconitase family protein [Brevibacterium jeotgali]